MQTSTFGSEFIALKIATELIESLWYKLRMFGVPIKGPANVFCDNHSVSTNESIPTSVLNKKHNALAYNACRWAVAAGVIRVGKVDTKDNIADALNKR